MTIALDTYSIGMMGVQFYGWPNGESLMEQENVVVEILGIIKSEMVRIATDGQK